MATENPLVTIVIIAYNEEKHINEAIESALSQSYRNIEIILVDDGSRDNTLAIARSYEPRIKVVGQANSGNSSCTRNTGLKASNGDYISFLDGDDLLLPDKIEQQVRLLAQYSNAGMVVGNYQNFGEGVTGSRDHFSTCPKLTELLDQSHNHTVTFTPGRAADILLDENFMITSSPLFRTDTIRSLGGFCERLYSCEDFHLHYRVALQVEVIVSGNIVFKRRMHGSNKSSNPLRMSKYRFISRALLESEEYDPKRKSELKKQLRAKYKNYLENSVKSRSYKELPILARSVLTIL